MSFGTTFGAVLGSGGTRFAVWAPNARDVRLVLYNSVDFTKEITRHPLQKDEEGIWRTEIASAAAGTLYKYQIDDQGPFPDPASRYQPHGVHGPSGVVDSRFNWTDSTFNVRRFVVLLFVMKSGAALGGREKEPHCGF